MKNLRRLTSFEIDQSERKSSQVNASARTPGQTESQVDPSYQLASTYDPVWPGFLHHWLKQGTCYDFQYLSIVSGKLGQGNNLIIIMSLFMKSSLKTLFIGFSFPCGRKTFRKRSSVFVKD